MKNNKRLAEIRQEMDSFEQYPTRDVEELERRAARLAVLRTELENLIKEE